MQREKDYWRDVEGWLAIPEGEELQRLATARNVLEIGSYRGRSTTAMAAVAHRVVACDHFRGDSYTGPIDHEETLLAYFRALDGAGVTGVVTTMVGSAANSLNLLRNHPFELIFYDADHTKEATEQAMRWAQICHPRAVLAVHDYDDSYPHYAGAKRAIDEHDGRYGKLLRVIQKLAIMEPKV